MVVSVLVVADRPLLDTLLRHIQRNVDQAVSRIPLSCENAQLYGIQSRTGISAGYIRKKICRLIIDHSMIAAHSFFLIPHCPQDQFLHVILFQGLQLKNAGAGKKRPVHFEVGIFRSCPNENQGSVLHIRKQVILLALIKAVDLVYK